MNAILVTMTHPIFTFFPLALGVMIASWKISLRYLHFFQQEEYDNPRFLYWWLHSRSIEKRATLLTLIFGLALWNSEPYAHISRLPLGRTLFLSCLIALGIAWAGWSNHGAPAKKALVMTARAKRIFSISFLLQFLFFSVLAYFAQLMHFHSHHLLIHTFLATVLLLTIPLWIVAANLCLIPYESIVQKKYLREAREILARVKPEIIGITGSYGKTSFKHILSHILDSHAPTLATPGSVNTQMGITRIIRERLRNEHIYFIVEMGAYGIGSIRRLCELTPPKTAIVTAIGLAHMERFKSIEAVYQAKSELPRSLAANGLAILNGDDPNLRRMQELIQTPIHWYGTNPEMGPLDCQLLQAEMTENGLHCSLRYEGKNYSFEMPLFGEHQAQNACGAFLTAMLLGGSPLTAIAALQSMPPITHRLVVQKNPGGIITIDDAYNSNPVGFEYALRVMQSLPGKRKILITPGMVELGDLAEKNHAKIAICAAQVCDQIVLVAANRLQGFRKALLDQGFPQDHIREFRALREAQEWLNGEIRSGDVILYENDLPDLYETPTAFTLF